MLNFVSWCRATRLKTTSAATSLIKLKREDPLPLAVTLKARRCQSTLRRRKEDPSTGSLKRFVRVKSCEVLFRPGPQISKRRARDR